MNKYKIYNQDCVQPLKDLEDNSVDSIITDPPYGLGFMGKEWDSLPPSREVFEECLRVLKPGGHLLSFSGTRTYHRMAVAIEDAGFEIRDMIEWVYGSGFPKSLNIGKAVDKLQGVEHPKNTLVSENGSMSGGNYTHNKMNVQSELAKQWEGWGTALKPAHEPICMARKPLAEKTVSENVLKYGTGGINIDESRVGAEERYNAPACNKAGGNSLNMSAVGMPQDADGTTTTGRFPANLIHDNSEEVRECFPETKAEIGRAGRKSGGNYNASSYKVGVVTESGTKDSGNASRFFKSIIYQAKASKVERNKGCEGLDEKKYSHDGRDKEIENPYQRNKSVSTNNHPTVKPIALMEYLIKMVTPEGGIVLDPFTGSGTTGVAALQNGYKFIGIEKESEYIPIIEARLESVNKLKEM